MALDEVWERLVTAALLGTERSGEVHGPDGELAAVVEGAGEGTRERRLLVSAAAVDLYRRAGVMAGTNAKAVEVAPAETLPAVTRKADSDLQRMLGGTYEGALPEWLDACGKAGGSGKRVRERSLPGLLDAALKAEALRKKAEKVMGERGRWLLLQTGATAWRKAFETLTVEAWETGTKEERLRYLRQVRREDAGGARQLLEKTWLQETPEERAKFIEVLGEGLSMEDEPFLEGALDDKRKEVRQQAAELLAKLPESRLAMRMFGRASELITVKTKLLGKAKLEVTVPETRTPEMARDGIAEESDVYGLGQKAYWLSRIVAATPMRFWSATLKLDADGLRKALAKNEWSLAVFRGLAEAAARQCDQPYARVLLQQWAWELAEKEVHQHAELVTRLVASLPDKEREAALMPFLSRADAFLERDVLLHMLQGCGHCWSREFSEKFTRLLLYYLEHERSSYYALREIAATFGYLVHPDIGPALAAQVAGVEKYQSKYLDEFLAIVQFRHDMLKELSK